MTALASSLDSLIPKTRLITFSSPGFNLSLCCSTPPRIKREASESVQSCPFTTTSGRWNRAHADASGSVSVLVGPQNLVRSPSQAYTGSVDARNAL